MATTITTGNYWKYCLLNNYSAASFAVILMQPGYVFNKATHQQYADISASEVVDGTGGYASAGYSLAGIAVTQDDSNSKGKITWNALTITPSGASISIGGIVLQQSTNDIIVGFGNTGTVTIADGQPYVLTGIEVDNT